MFKKLKSLLITGLASIALFSMFSIGQDKSSAPARAVGVDGITLAPDSSFGYMIKEDDYSASNPHYATLARGNNAYLNIYALGYKNETITVEYHTVNASAIAGVDYTEVSNGKVTIASGDDIRKVQIAVTTQNTTLGLNGFKGTSYTARSFFVYIDRAYTGNGSVVPIVETSIPHAGTTVCGRRQIKVVLNANNKLDTQSKDGYYRLSAYGRHIYQGFYYEDVPCNNTRSGVAFEDGDDEFELVKKLGLGDYFAEGLCSLSEPQTSDEELTRFIVGNESWAKWGGCSYATRGTGWFYGCEFRYDRTSINDSIIAKMVEGSSDRYDYVAMYDVNGSPNYCPDESCYYFRNSNSIMAGFSVYRYNATDGKINISVSMYERVMDTTRPQVSKVYLDTTSLYKTEGKYRASVRFTEPVQCGEGTKVLAEANSSLQLEFNYAGGSGTDTLYFDCDTSKYENVNIKSLTFNNSIGTTVQTAGNTYINFRNIRDMYGNTLDNVGANAYAKFNVSLDKRIPVVSVDGVNSSSDFPQRQPTVALTLEKFSSGTLYYAWVKKEDDEAYLEGHQQNSLFLANKLKTQSLDSTNALTGYIELNSESADGQTKTQVMLDSPSSNGEFYLYCFCDPVFGIKSEDNIKVYKYGTYLVDNTKPTISNLVENLNPVAEGGFNRKFTFNVNDLNGIESITALVKESNKKGAKVNTMALSANDEGVVNFTLDLNDLINRYYTDSEGRVTVNPESGHYDVNFEVKDRAGNVAKAFETDQSYYLSTVPYFKANMNIDDPSKEIIANRLYGVGSSFTFTHSDTNLSKELIKVQVNGDGVYLDAPTENPSFTLNYEGTAGTHNPDADCEATVTFLEPGYYVIKMECAGSYSDEFEFYITDSFKENTNNYSKAYSNELLLTNKVFQINENVQYLFINDNKQIEKEYYNGATNPTFSSETAALNFLKFYEYKDLKYEVLTSNTASYLNTGSGEGYNKAPGETKVASSGQVWIRYKKATSWNVNSESINDWAYYFYANEDDGYNTIDIEQISENLKSAINSICKKICDRTGTTANAGDVYLVDDEHLNPKTRAPYLSEAQISISRPQTLDESKTGTVLANANYAGDPNLFENTIKKEINGRTSYLPIATNLSFDNNEKTKIYVATYTPGVEPNFIEVKLKDNMTLKEAILSVSATSGASITLTSNVYIVRELDENGARDFYVYVDADAPRLAIELNESGNVEYMDSREIANLFANKFVLKGIGNGYDGDALTYTEIDKYAYVALFKKQGLALYTIHYNGEIANESIEEGSYLVNIGDRSGNVYSFFLYISNSLPKITFKPGDTKFDISIDNRTTDELQSVEIYCNDVLVSSNLNTKFTFTQNGIYKVVIVDKYGNEYSETQEFTREKPNIEFLYDEGNDGFFTKYKEGNTDYMIITPGENYTLVSTSRRVKIALNSDECDFEISGILPSDYTYDSEKHEIEIKNAASFYIDIWNSTQNEDMMSYKVVLDDKAPTISVKTDDKKLTFDETLASSYDAGVYTDPSSIKYSPSNNVVEVDVLQDDIVTNEFVNVDIKDETGIKDIKVYQNDVLVKTYTAEDITDGKISFHIGNKKGDVKIVATDLFNNVTSYMFQFEDQKASNGTIDGKYIEENLTNTYYGNDTAIITADTGSEIHLQYEANGQLYNEIYKYVDGQLYIGEYKHVSGQELEPGVFSEDKYGLVDYYNGGMQITDEYGNNIYVDKPVTLDIDNTYKPHNNVELYLVCDPATGKVQVILEATNSAQKVDVRVNKENTIADYYSFELSKEVGKLNFSSTDGSVVDNGSRILANTDNVDITYDINDIVEVKVAYNPISNDFREDDYIYTIDNMFENGEGYYSIKVVNKYGNVVYYNLIYSNSINASVELTYLEKDPEVFTVNYSNEFFTNGKATFVGYNLETLKGVTSDGSIISPAVDGDMMTLEVEESATVTIKDIYGNEKIINLVVGKDANFKYDTNNEWIVGYSELANKEKGYSNVPLSIGLTQAQINSYGITQIRIECDGQITTVYGYDGLSYVNYNADLLANCIGADGTNVYKVMFADKYGDIVTKEIHYSEESTLNISRQTSSSVYTENITIEDALANGVWSNREIMLGSALKDEDLYKFYIKSDGETNYREVSLPYVLELASTSQNGTLKYFVKYVDAYGYSHEIACTLNRQDIKCDAEDMDFVTINQVDYTRDPVKFTFTDDIKATYSINNFEEESYKSGDVLYLDGNYTFKFVDISGNTRTIVFTKDSSCKFSITSPSGDVTAYNGGVINANQLDFNSLGDSSRITHVMYNGEYMEAKEDMSFTKSGHYELIIKDDVGNTAYFHFYLINHSTSTFNYEVPTNFEISEVYRTNNGVRSPYMDAVDSSKTQLILTQDGSYDVVLKNVYQDMTTNFSIDINNDLPVAKLDGCDENSVTTNDIGLKDLAYDDIIEIYKDGELIARYDENSDNAFKSITEGGKYRIVVTNAQGVSKELCFTKKNIANPALSILIISGCVIAAGGFFIGLLLRNRSKFDE